MMRTDCAKLESILNKINGVNVPVSFCMVFPFITLIISTESTAR